MPTALSGWGRYPVVPCEVAQPGTVAQVAATLGAPSGTHIARGLGRSYGDAALDGHGVVLDCTGLDRYRSFDPDTGTLTCEAGTSLAQILRDFGPRGFLPAVTPGTKFVTVGGCIANDVHGKAHHADGCFSRCTESMRIALASGEVVNASPTENAELYWASFGGMGLLGVIVEATIRLRRVETTYFRQTALAVPDLDAMLDAIDAHHHLPYSVAWVDSLATGSRLGRGVLTVGDHATLADLPASLRASPLSVTPPSPLVLPFELPGRALNTATIRALNVVLEQVQAHGAAYAHYEKFFYPLDFIGQWNRGYGRRGFTQYQFVIPMENGRANIRTLLSLVANSGQAPFLNVLKRFGPERDETSLSFPFEGYTFAIDFPIRPGLEGVLRELDRHVLAMDGRVYLGKDAFLQRPTFEAMYPRLDRWKAVKHAVDPASRFSSELGRRLGLSAG
ncbi:MAG: FAD-binding oxidoreductase [Myxococcota bacterium]